MLAGYHHDDQGDGKDGPVSRVFIIGAVSQPCGNRAVDLVEQGSRSGKRGLVRGGQLGGQDLAAAGGIDGEMQSAPASARLAVVLLMQPLARTKHLRT